MYARAATHGHAETADAGFTLVELMITLTVIMIGLLGVAGLTITLYGHSLTNSEQRIALRAAQHQIERMSTEDFREIFLRYDGNKDNDPEPGAPGPWFEVKELEAAPGHPRGMAGRITLPVGPPPGGSSSSPLVLREDVQNSAMGMPADLDGDGVVDDQPKDVSYIHLPVIVEVRWTGKLGLQSTRLVTWLTPNEEVVFP